MGVLDIEINFDRTAPEPRAIVDAVSAASGLTTRWISHDDPDDDLHEFIGELRFEESPDSCAKLHVYKPGAVRRFFNETFDDNGHPVAEHLQGLKEPEGKQTVYLRGYLLAEPTLLIAILSGLDALGGSVVGEPFPEEVLERYSLPVTVEQLEQRKRAAARQARKVVWCNLAACVIIGPFWLLVGIVSLPFSIWRAWRSCRPVD